MNDVMSIWDGAEANNINDANSGIYTSIPALVLGWMSDSDFPFFQRLPGILVILGGLAGFYGIGWRIFGKETTLLTILFIAATFLVPTLGKLATLDSWVFVAQLLAIVSLLRFMKEPIFLWQLVCYLFLLFALWLEPLGTLILSLSFSIGLLIKHPQGRNLLKLQPWLVLLSGLAIGYILNLLTWQQPGLLIGFFQLSYAKYFLISLLALFPIIGFCLGGIRDLFLKLGRGEELSIVLISWILGAILAESTILQVGFCLLAVKQLQAWSNPKYPFRNWVKTGAILHMLLVFGFGFYLMTKGFIEFGPAGYRAGLVVTLAYWTVSLVGVIGLYSGRRPLLIIGHVLSGLIPALIFWLSVYPLVESKRLPVKVLSTIEKMDIQQQKAMYFISEEKGPPLSLKFKAEEENRSFYWLRSQAALKMLENETTPAGIYVFSAANKNQFFNQTSDSTRTIKIWTDKLMTEDWIIVDHTP
ncbi:MAG: hypothetical protein DHS20C18_12410 [Saprospiraceae bacterium]|nr:MAG: hypothetical protein DHS20C18_12410 [Saprospiraceae bacterium]